MAQRSHVPKFGNWESEDNVPYTVYFDKARKGRSGGKMINPNDPQENPDMFSNTSPPEHAPPSRTTTRPEEPTGGAAVRPTHEHQMGREDGDLRQFTESPARNDNTGRKAANGSSAQQRHGGHGSGSARPVRHSTGSDHSIDRSPLHPHYQARLAGKGSDSPSREGKNSYDGGHGTPGRSRLKPFTRGDESPDGGAAVPKFGEWDEKNPSSADGFTHIFNKVREERRNLPAKSPSRETLSPYNGRNQNASEKPKSCCFPWFTK